MYFVILCCCYSLLFIEKHQVYAIQVALQMLMSPSKQELSINPPLRPYGPVLEDDLVYKCVYKYVCMYIYTFVCVSVSVCLYTYIFKSSFPIRQTAVFVFLSLPFLHNLMVSGFSFKISFF